MRRPGNSKKVQKPPQPGDQLGEHITTTIRSLSKRDI